MATLFESRRAQMFPKLTPAQLTRLDSYGERTRTQESEVLIESGDRYRRIVAVISGSLEVVIPGAGAETPITQLTVGDFTGEMSALRGSKSFVRTRVREAGEVISIPVENLRRLIQTDAELSEIFMRAYILRRMGLRETGRRLSVFVWWGRGLARRFGVHVLERERRSYRASTRAPTATRSSSSSSSTWWSIADRPAGRPAETGNEDRRMPRRPGSTRRSARPGRGGCRALRQLPVATPPKG